MSDFANYLLAQSEKREAYSNYNHASAKLKNAQIEERLYEIISQNDPIAMWVDKLGVSDSMAKLIRTEIIYFARYVVCGRKDRDANA